MIIDWHFLKEICFDSFGSHSMEGQGLNPEHWITLVLKENKQAILPVGLRSKSGFVHVKSTAKKIK